MDVINQYLPLYQQAFYLTIRLGFLGIVGAIAAGLVVALIRLYKLPILSPLFGAYIEVSRNTPLLIQLFFLYFGLPRVRIILSSETCALIGLTFLGGSYMAETFRSVLEAVSNSQKEISRSIGLKESQILRYIVFPQALSISLPSISANIIFLIKETSVFSAVALADLMYVAKDLIGLYYETDIALWMLVISYLIILLPTSLLCHYLERRLRYAEFRDTGTFSRK